MRFNNQIFILKTALLSDYAHSSAYCCINDLLWKDDLSQFFSAQANLLGKWTAISISHAVQTMQDLNVSFPGATTLCQDVKRRLGQKSRAISDDTAVSTFNTLTPAWTTENPKDRNFSISKGTNPPSGPIARVTGLVTSRGQGSRPEGWATSESVPSAIPGNSSSTKGLKRCLSSTSGSIVSRACSSPSTS